MKYRILTLIFCPFLANAEVKFGLTHMASENYISVQDIQAFRLDRPSMFGLYRYGIGKGEILLGQPNIGIRAHDYSGVFLSDNTGIEPASGRVSFINSRANIEWQPAYMYTPFKASDFSLVGARLGLSANVYSNTTLLGLVSIVQLNRSTLTVFYNYLPGRYVYYDGYAATNQSQVVLDINVNNQHSVGAILEQNSAMYYIGTEF